MSKRKMDTNAVVDENERSLYSIFRDTANLLSKFFSISIHNQNLAYEAGESRAILEIHEWVLAKFKEGEMISIPDVLSYLQAKMESLSANGSGWNTASPGAAASSLALLEQGSYPGMGASSSVGVATSSVATLNQGGCPGMGPSSSLGMATSSVAPMDQGCYPGMESAQKTGCSFGPQDQNGAEMEALFISPEELSNYLENMLGRASAPQGQDSYPDTQMGGM